MFVALNESRVVVCASRLRVVLRYRGSRRLRRSDVPERAQLRQRLLVRAAAGRGGRRGGVLEVAVVIQLRQTGQQAKRLADVADRRGTRDAGPPNHENSFIA